MERGRINGVPIWIKSIEVTGNERTIVQEAPAVDGATVEVQGQGPVSYRIEFEVFTDGEHIIDSVDVAATNLRGVLALGGPFELEMPLGPAGYDIKAGLWLDGPWSMRAYDPNRLGAQSGSLSLLNAEPLPEFADDARKLIVGSIQALAGAAIQEFDRRAPEEFGFDTEALDVFGRGVEWLGSTQGKIASALGPVTGVAAQVSQLSSSLETLLQTPSLFASTFFSTAMQLVSLIPALAKQGSSAAGGDDTSDVPKDVLVDTTKGGAGFNDGFPTAADELGDEASDEDHASDLEAKRAGDLVLSSVITSVCYAASETTFTTAEAVVEFAIELQALVEQLLESPTVDYRVQARARITWLATVKLLAEEAAKLPRLVSYTVPDDTDALNLVADFYNTEIRGVEQLEAALDRFLRSNRIPDPTRIRSGTVVRLLQGSPTA